jgi:hypothetical protein
MVAELKRRGLTSWNCPFFNYKLFVHLILAVNFFYNYCGKGLSIKLIIANLQQHAK